MSNTTEVLTDTDQEVIDIDADWEPMLSHGKPSHQLESIRYFSSELLLYVRFPGGSIYRYDNVPPHIVTQLRSADSKGSFFILNIKKAPFPYKKIKDKSQAPPVEIVGQSGVEVVDAPLIDEAPVKIELPKLEQEILTIIDQANAMQVTTQEEANLASAWLSHRKSVLAAFLEWFAPIKEATWAAHKKNTEKEKSIKEPNEKAIEIVRRKITLFVFEKARKAEEEAERIRLEAVKAEQARREKEEAERKERQRIEDEARAKEEASIKSEREKLEAEKKAQADALAKAGMEAEAERIRKETAAKIELQKLLDEQKRIKEENARLEEERRAKEALEAPIYVPEPVVVVEKTEGVTGAVAWKAEVVDIRAFCRGIAEGKTPPDVITVNQRKLDALAKTWKGRTGEHHPGVRAFEDKTIRTR